MVSSLSIFVIPVFGYLFKFFNTDFQFPSCFGPVAHRERAYVSLCCKWRIHMFPLVVRIRVIRFRPACS